MRRLLPSLIAGATAFLLTSAASAEELAFGKAPVSDDALSDARGGFTIPGGIDISIAVQSDTRINGVLQLRSIFVAHQGPPTLEVFARSNAAPASSDANAGQGGPTATGTTSVSRSVSLAGAPATAIGEDQQGLTKLDLAAGGAGVAAAGGVVTLERFGSAGSQVVLSRSTLDVQHLVGQAYGTIAANRGNDVTIDTSTIINLDLRNATPLNVGSAMARIETLGLNAAAALGGR